MTFLGFLMKRLFLFFFFALIKGYQIPLKHAIRQVLNCIDRTLQSQCSDGSRKFGGQVTFFRSKVFLCRSYAN